MDKFNCKITELPAVWQWGRNNNHTSEKSYNEGRDRKVRLIRNESKYHPCSYKNHDSALDTLTFCGNGSRISRFREVMQLNFFPAHNVFSLLSTLILNQINTIFQHRPKGLLVFFIPESEILHSENRTRSVRTICHSFHKKHQKIAGFFARLSLYSQWTISEEGKA